MRGAGFADSIFITNAVMWQIETRLHARGRHINMRRSIFSKKPKQFGENEMKEMSRYTKRRLRLR